MQARSTPGFSEHSSFDSVLGQHRHDAVGEIDRVAALARGAVERVARAHVPGDVGDRDERMPAAGARRIGLGPDRIVEIAGVGAVDGDQRHSAQIGRGRPAPPAAPWPASVERRLGNSVGMPWLWMAMRLKARGSALSPMRSTIRASGRPSGAAAAISASTISPSAAPPLSRGGDAELGPDLAVGGLEPPAVAARGDRCRARGRARRRPRGRCAPPRRRARCGCSAPPRARPTPSAGAPRSAIDDGCRAAGASLGPAERPAAHLAVEIDLR